MSERSSVPVAVLGLGLLGAGFALRLAEAGHTVQVWNRSPEKAAALAGPGVVVCDSPAAAVRGAGRVHLILSEDDAVDAVLEAAGAALPPAAPILDHSTNRPDRVAARAAALRARGLRYLHAPVFMGPRDSRGATGLMLIAGPTAEVEALRPALEAMTGKLWHVGEAAGLAAVHKLSGNALLLGMSGLMGDILKMGAAQGLSAEQSLSLFEVFKPGAALPLFGQRVVRAPEAPTSFSLHMARKDLRLMVATAGGPGGLQVLPAVAAAMDAALERGLGDKDFAIYAG